MGNPPSITVDVNAWNKYNEWSPKSPREGYTNPNIALSAAYWMYRIIERERFINGKSPNEVVLLTIDGSSSTLSSYVKLFGESYFMSFSPKRETVNRFEFLGDFNRKNAFFVFVDDYLCLGDSAKSVYYKLGRSVDLFITISESDRYSNINYLYKKRFCLRTMSDELLNRY